MWLRWNPTEPMWMRPCRHWMQLPRSSTTVLQLWMWSLDLPGKLSPLFISCLLRKILEVYFEETLYNVFYFHNINSFQVSCSSCQKQQPSVVIVPQYPQCTPQCMPSCQNSCVQQACVQACQPMCNSQCIQQQAAQVVVVQQPQQQQQCVQQCMPSCTPQCVQSACTPGNFDFRFIVVDL